MENKKDRIAEINVDILIEKSQLSVKNIENQCIIVTAQLENGFVITETHSFIDKDNFNIGIGVEKCIDKIKNKLWELEAYRLQCIL